MKPLNSPLVGAAAVSMGFSVAQSIRRALPSTIKALVVSGRKTIFWLKMVSVSRIIWLSAIHNAVLATVTAKSF
ncbi:MAG: hypothetical protein II894_07375, partial [Bacteroidales bacterium]|nr:hypothetical protein [Bacteroidales bacterium]